MVGKKKGNVSAGANPAMAAAMLALRSSGAAGVHKQARRPVRAEGRRRAIQESRDAG